MANGEAGTSEVIQGLDILDIVGVVSKKNKKYQAMLLQDIEETVGVGFPEYPKIRKAVLDNFNSYTRSILRAIFGQDFEL
jgi:hypothetical protein